MKYAIFGTGLLSLSLLTGCNLNDLSNVEAIKSDTNISAVSLDSKHGLVGNQVISKQGNHWVKSQVLNAENSGWSGETVSINHKQAIIADAHNQSAKIFSLNDYSKEWELSANLYEPSLYGFGESVYIDNNIALIGAPFSNTVISYKKMDGYWEEQERISENLIENAYFGGSIDYQGGYLFVGAKTIDKAFIYKYEADSFKLVQTLDHFDASVPGGKQFGWSLDANKDQLAIGAYRDWSNSEKTQQGGQVHIYQKSGDIWKLTQSVTAFELDATSGDTRDINGYNFGHNLALNNSSLLIGDDGMEQIFQFKLSEHNMWIATRVITPMPERSEKFGYFLDVNQDFLLAGGFKPTLFGPQVPKATISGKVIDANGFPIKRAIISGFLDDLYTDELGQFDSLQAISWQGNIKVTSGLTSSGDIDIPTLFEDRLLDDIQLDIVPEHLVIGAISGLPRTENISVSVSGIEEPIITRAGRFSVRLTNGWQGEVRPISDIYQFEPSSITIDGLTDFKSISFQATLKN